eukprot:CAMPEP_0174261924 /NCGR_PEP_ID=MMETSP0439-20130205/12670_1 /TAXON_ID=0 /ORGANISM="Stereomyxa ramosa, Strain Chinc5" /LENGTH=793 /DNA_ID=CAMNT_0015346537 /DNA_START=61 /DNA_END=2442 /DNA_ORIENTATION=+
MLSEPSPPSQNESTPGEMQPRVILLGPPGTGKGTQGRMLGSKYGIRSLSVGDLFRKEKADATVLGRYLAENWRTFELEGIAHELIYTEIAKAVEEKSGFVLDGCPRSMLGANLLLSNMKKLNYKIDAVVVLNMDKAELWERMSNRLTHIPSGRTYSPSLPPKVPGKDDITGEDLVVRQDEGAFEVRYKAWEDHGNQVVEFFKSEGSMPLLELDARDHPDTICQQICQFVDVAVQAQQSAVSTNSGNNCSTDSGTTHDQDGFDPSFLEVKDYFTEVSVVENAEIRQRVKEMVEKYFKRDKTATFFPGLQPTTVSFQNSEKLFRYSYVVLPKLDGERKLVFVFDNSLFFIGRKNTVWKYRLDPSFVPDCCNGVLLDGELVWTKKPGNDSSHDDKNNAPALCFVVFDLMFSFGGDDVSQLRFSLRMENAKKVLEALHRQNKNNDDNTHKLCFRLQEIYPLEDTGKVIDFERDRNYPFELDGIVFMPDGLPYHFGFSRNVMKWKQPSSNTIDFSLIESIEFVDGAPVRQWQLGVGDKGDTAVFDYIELSDEDIAKFSLKHGDIVECWYNPQIKRRHQETNNRLSGSWFVSRVREDKSRPNADWVVYGIIESIQENIDEQKILNLIKEGISAPKNSWKDNHKRNNPQRRNHHGGGGNYSRNNNKYNGPQRNHNNNKNENNSNSDNSNAWGRKNQQRNNQNSNSNVWGDQRKNNDGTNNTNNNNSAGGWGDRNQTSRRNHNDRKNYNNNSNHGSKEGNYNERKNYYNNRNNYNSNNNQLEQESIDGWTTIGKKRRKRGN